ncbi:unnamed protein product [Mytilus edulis]|uniref:SEA domain-containing protein n=1 Tax=Mytilus edulis TaxID=6550 RepID=A0A8S3VJR2_MYTED|nr:unnamed protein product [Mytilus edulis]
MKMMERMTLLKRTPVYRMMKPLLTNHQADLLIKSFLGKFMPNLSWRKTGDSPIVTEKGDNSIKDESASGSVSNRNSLSPKKASSMFTDRKGTVTLEGKIKLKNKWTDDLLDPSTEEYKTLSTNFVTEINGLLQNSNVSKVYMNDVVVIKYSNIQNNTRSTRKSPGNIMVHSEMTFHHTYTKLFSNLNELCDNIEDFIILQSSLGETGGTIQMEDGADSVNTSENVPGREKTIMVIGATGSGKTTLVDGMINYITDVSWEDEFRFSMVDLTEDEKKRKASESESQTEWITCYTINKMEGSTIDYTLNIIDTPGFGDTRGIPRDKRIVDQIREFFTTPGRQGITCLDAVCFVTQAPLGKLTPPQRYIFDQILSVFGQDIKSNIFVLITFADANEPPVRAALKAANVPYQKSYKFNNSALYASPENQAEAEMGNLFWKMGRESFKTFFDELRTVESKSLLLTSEVLQLRKRLETTIQGLQKQIADGMNKLNTIKQEKEILKRHKEDIKAKKDFTYEVDEVHMYQIDLEPGVYVTNCMACNRTCHFPCGIPDDKNKQNCAAIDGEKCTICPMHCHWNIHKNNSFRFDTYTMKVTKTYDELKKKYEVAQKEAEKHKSVLGKVKTAFSTLGLDVMKMVHEVRLLINKLHDIALRPNPLSDKDYIDLLIESEKSERKYGWDKRISLFNKLREEAALLEQMHQKNFQPWVYIDSDESDEDDEKTDDSQDNTDDDEKTDDSQENDDGSTADDEDYKPKDLPLYQEPDMDVE